MKGSSKVEAVTLTLDVPADDGTVRRSVFFLEPRTFCLDRSRDVRPVYENGVMVDAKTSRTTHLQLRGDALDLDPQVPHSIRRLVQNCCDCPMLVDSGFGTGECPYLPDPIEKVMDSFDLKPPPDGCPLLKGHIVVTLQDP